MGGRRSGDTGALGAASTSSVTMDKAATTAMGEVSATVPCWKQAHAQQPTAQQSVVASAWSSPSEILSWQPLCFGCDIAVSTPVATPWQTIPTAIAMPATLLITRIMAKSQCRLVRRIDMTVSLHRL